MSTIFKPELYSDFSNSTRMNKNNQVGHSKQETINNYWTRLSKMSWFVCGEQRIDMRDTDESRSFAIRPSSIIASSFDHWVCFFNEYPWEAKRSAISHARAIARRRKARFPLRMSRILFAAKHCWTALHMSIPLFVGSYLQVTWWALGQWKERENCFEW